MEFLVQVALVSRIVHERIDVFLMAFWGSLFRLRELMDASHVLAFVSRIIAIVAIVIAIVPIVLVISVVAT